MKRLVSIVLVMTIFASVMHGCSLPRYQHTPVVLSMSDEDDACGGVGVATNRYSTRIDVMSAATNLSKKLFSIEQGAQLLLCDETPGWYGVIEINTGIKCINYHEIQNSTIYTGPCRYGWIEKTHINLFAG